MTPSSKPLLSLTAGDLMSLAVVVVPEQMSLRGAARMLSNARVTGAPVADAQGCCIGVISATDFVHWAKHDRHSRRPSCAYEEMVCEGQIIDQEALPEESVGQFMTRDVVTAPPSIPVGELARMMLDAHIHRVIVADPDGKPLGIVSSTDVLAAVVRADAARRHAGEESAPLEARSC